ncbi:MAG TPA: ABC transporter substrate-binding protein [Microbacteriaceae bacterium]|nr:ABC transporter substrate-binding protein [Microbacteriaceae bacterium]
MRITTPLRAAIALSAILVLASCSAPGDAAPSSSSSSDAVADRTATVTYAGVVTPSNLDPHRGVTENDIPFLRYIYDPLTTVTPEGVPAPFLAESWELSEDGNTFTMVMREGATFVDGEPVDAAAVVANLDRMINDPNSTVAYVLAPIIASSEVVDERTVKLNLQAPGGALPTIFASRTGMMVSPKALANPESLVTTPAGAGAFELVSSAPGSRYSFERRADYWDEDAYPYAKLEYLIQVDTATRLNALQAGETTLTPVVGPQKAEAEAAGLSTWMAEGAGTSFTRLSMNSARSEFGSKQVRQAMNAAADRQGIATTLYAGQCVPSAQPYPKGYFAHSDTVDDSGWSTYDPDAAKKLLAEAGLANGFSFTAAVPSLSIYNNTALVLQQNFADVGITMNIEVMDATQARQAFVTGSVDALVGVYGGSTDPGLYALSAYSPKSGDNPGGLTTPNMAALIADTQRSTDIAERGVAYDALMEEVFEMGPAQIALCAPVGVHAGQNFVHEFNQEGPLGASGAMRSMWVSE